MFLKKLQNLFNRIYSFIFPGLAGLFGSLTGSENGKKMLRRFFIPASITSLAFSKTESILTLSIMSMMGFFSMGYGIPGMGGDAGSKLGRFFYRLTKQNHLLSDLLTRGTIGLGVSISLISVPIIKQNWLIYGISSLAIILAYALISWRGLGQFTLFNKKLNWSEFILYTIIALASVILINF